jgi:hypothetical protein
MYPEQLRSVCNKRPDFIVQNVCIGELWFWRYLKNRQMVFFSGAEGLLLTTGVQIPTQTLGYLEERRLGTVVISGKDRPWRPIGL